MQMYTMGVHCKALGLDIGTAGNTESLRTSKRKSFHPIDQTPTYDIISNERYQSLLKYTAIEFRNPDQKVEFNADSRTLSVDSSELDENDLILMTLFNGHFNNLLSCKFQFKTEYGIQALSRRLTQHRIT